MFNINCGCIIPLVLIYPADCKELNKSDVFSDRSKLFISPSVMTPVVPTLVSLLSYCLCFLCLALVKDHKSSDTGPKDVPIYSKYIADVLPSSKLPNLVTVGDQK